MNKEFQNKKHTQTRMGTHTKEIQRALGSRPPPTNKGPPAQTRPTTRSSSFIYFYLTPRDFVSSISKWQKSITRTTRMTNIFENFEIHQKFAEIGRFEFGISLQTR